MALRFMKCLVVVALIHVFAAALVFGAYHFTRAGKPEIAAKGSPSETQDFVIMAPVGENKATEAAISQETPKVNKPEKHVVQRGESYWSIANKYGVTITQLREENGHRSGRMLQNGDKLFIPRN